jgi:Ala-tRNA(Pro) deacylase
MAAAALTTRLDADGVEYELIAHTHTERAADEAEALDVPGASVAKTLVITTPDGYLRAVLPAPERLDLHKLREVVGAGSKAIHLASEDDLERDYAEFELGAVPPIGGRPDPVLIDAQLAQLEQVVFEAGSHEESVRMRADDLVRLSGARVVDLCEA